MSELAQQLIAENKLTKNPYLDLGNCGLRKWPKELFDCIWLEEINMCSTRFDLKTRKVIESKNFGKYNTFLDIPIEIQKLQNLKVLCINVFNEHSSISLDITPISKLIHLQYLDLSACKIEDINPLYSLVNLQYLKLNGNNIANVFSIAHLINLQSLILGGNAIEDISALANLTNLECLELYMNFIDDISSLINLTNLQTLDLSVNKIVDISSLSNLVNLKELNLDYNQLRDLEPLSRLTNLENLSLINNCIFDINPLKKLLKLKFLYLKSNRIKFVDDSLLECLKNLYHLEISFNPIKNIKREIVDLHECVEPLKEYFKRLANGEITDFEAKIILIGNGGVGKTSLLKRWIYNKFDPNEKSTHGIVVESFDFNDLPIKQNYENLRLNIWDFCGLDIYHSLHSHFLQTDALFLLVWDAQTEEKQTQTEILHTIKTVVYRNYRKNYWLNYIKTLSKNSPIIIVQTKRDKYQCKELDFTISEKKYYNIKGVLAVESESADVANGFDKLRVAVSQCIAKQLKESSASLSTSWLGIKYTIEEILENNGLKNEEDKIRQIHIDDFAVLCKKKGLDNREANQLIEYFHNSGLFYYKKGIFDNNIVLDQQWTINAIYIIFNRNNFFANRHPYGRFKGIDLSVIWSKPNNNGIAYSLVEQKHFISFMLQCEICFESEIGYEAFLEKSFIAPQLLPFEKPSTLSHKSLFKRDLINDQSYLSFNKKLVYYKYKFKFLKAFTIQRFIVRCGQLARVTDLWQLGMVLTWGDRPAMIEAFPETDEILIKMEDRSDKSLLDRIRNEMVKILEAETEIEEFISLNGFEYVNLKKLRYLPKENKLIEAENKIVVSAANYQPFLHFSKDLIFFQPSITITDAPKIKEMMEETKINSKTIRTEPINVFLSYSHIDEPLKDDLDKSLSALKHSNKIKTWNDRKMKGGDVWDNSIKKQLEKADLILLLISADFMASKYIWEVEITKALEKHNSKQAKVIPIFLRHCDFEGMPFEKLQGFPKDAKPVNSFADKDEAFTQIAKGIRSVVDTFFV